MIERFTFDRLRTTLLFLTIAVAACLMPAQNDTWWQLRAGRDMWTSQSVLLSDTYSHTAYGAFWPNHEWLSQVVFYALYAMGGLPLLTLACAAAIVGVWAIIWACTPAPSRAKFLLTVFVLASASTTWSPRPQVLSLLLVAIAVALLSHRRYAWLPGLFWLWANLHGAVLLGVLMLGAALVATLVEDIESFPRLAFVTALCLLATALTPLGWRFWLDIPASLARVRLLGIEEWTPPRLTSGALFPFWVTIVALVGLVASRWRGLLRNAPRRQGHVTLCACALAVAPLALAAARNVPPFLMLAVPAIAALWPAGSVAAPPRPALRPRLNAGLVVGAAVLSIVTVTGAYATGLSRLKWTPLPAASLAALDGCHGNIYNRYDEGGYLIWFAPDRKVFLDGRQDPYPPSLIREQVRVETTGDFASLFRHYDVRCAYVPADSRLSAGLVASGWTPRYRDAVWTVLAR